MNNNNNNNNYVSYPKNVEDQCDNKSNIIKKYSIHKRKRILYKIFRCKQINDAIEKCKIKKGAKLYAFEYLKMNLNKYVRIKDVQDYCNKRTKEKTGNPLGDAGRPFEILRNNKLPSEWTYLNYKNFKYVKYTPELKYKLCSEIIVSNKYKDDGFSKQIIDIKLKLANYKCSITGISQDNSKLAADHFIPKEKGGISNETNCIIINKLLNEKKNNKMPIEWLCETILTNFMNICKNVGILQECKDKIIKFVEDF